MTPTSGAIFLYVVSAWAHANSGEALSASQLATVCAWPPALEAMALQHAAAASQLGPPVPRPLLGVGSTSVGVGPALALAVAPGVVAPDGVLPAAVGAVGAVT